MGDGSTRGLNPLFKGDMNPQGISRDRSQPVPTNTIGPTYNNENEIFIRYYQDCWGMNGF